MTALAKGRVQTVLGPVDPAEIGVTMMHEHILAFDHFEDRFICSKC